MPGVRGRVLEVLARTDAELTMRTVARLAGVSVNRAVAVLNNLVSLGVVERREAGSAALVRLASDNEAARSIVALAQLFDRVLVRLKEEASLIRPAPAAMIVFGSFARGEARPDSDIDVMVVRADDIAEDDESWIDAIGAWTTRARRITGNPVNVIEATASELPRLLKRRGSVWEEIANDGILLTGTDVSSLAAAARA